MKKKESSKKSFTSKINFKNLLATASAAAIALGSVGSASGENWSPGGNTDAVGNWVNSNGQALSTSNRMRSGDAIIRQGNQGVVFGGSNNFLADENGNPLPAGQNLRISEILTDPANRGGNNIHNRRLSNDESITLGNIPHVDHPGAHAGNYPGIANGQKGFFVDNDTSTFIFDGDDYSYFTRHGAFGNKGTLVIDSTSNANIILNTVNWNSNPNNIPAATNSLSVYNATLKVKTNLDHTRLHFTTFNTIEIGTAAEPATFRVGHVTENYYMNITNNFGSGEASIKFINDDSTLHLIHEVATNNHKIALRRGHNIGGDTDVNGNIIVENIGSDLLGISGWEGGESFGKSDVLRAKSVTYQGVGGFNTKNNLEVRRPYNVYAQNINIGMTEPGNVVVVDGEIKGGSNSVMTFVKTVDTSYKADGTTNFVRAVADNEKHTFSLVTHNTVDSGFEFHGRDANGGTEAIFQMSDVNFNGGNNYLVVDTVQMGQSITLDANIHGDMNAGTVTGELELISSGGKFTDFKSTSGGQNTINNVAFVRIRGNNGVSTIAAGDHKIGELQFWEGNNTLNLEDGANILKTDAGTGGEINTTLSTTANVRATGSGPTQETATINFLGNHRIEGLVGTERRIRVLNALGAGVVNFNEDVNSIFTIISHNDAEYCFDRNLLTAAVNFNLKGTLKMLTSGSILGGNINFNTGPVAALGDDAATLILGDGTTVAGSFVIINDNSAIIDIHGAATFNNAIGILPRQLHAMRFSGVDSAILRTGSATGSYSFDYGAGVSADIFARNLQVNNRNAVLDVQGDIAANFQFLEAGTLKIGDNKTLAGDITFMDSLDTGAPASGIVQIGDGSSVDGDVVNNSSEDKIGILEFLNPVVGTAGVTGNIGAVAPNRIEAVRYSGVGVSEVNGSINAGAVQVGNAGTVLEIDAAITANAEFLEDGKIVLKTGSVVTGDIVNNAGATGLGTVEFEDDPAMQVTGSIGDSTNGIKAAVFSAAGAITVKSSPNGAPYAVNQGSTDVDIYSDNIEFNMPAGTAALILGPGDVGAPGGVISATTNPMVIDIVNGAVVHSDIVSTIAQPNGIDVTVDGTINGDITGVNSVEIAKAAASVAVINAANIQATNTYFGAGNTTIGNNVTIDGSAHVGSDSSGAATGSNIDLGANTLTVIGSGNTLDFAGVNNLSLSVSGSGAIDSGGQIVVDSTSGGVSYQPGTEFVLTVDDVNLMPPPADGTIYSVVLNDGAMRTGMPLSLTATSNSGLMWLAQYDPATGNVNLIANNNPDVNVSQAQVEEDVSDDIQNMLNRLSSIETLAGVATGGDTTGTSAGDCGHFDEGMYGAWVSGAIGYVNQKEYKNDSGYKDTKFDVHVGADYKFAEDTIVGGAFSYVNHSIKHKDGKINDTTKLDSYLFSLYGLQNVTDSMFVDAALTVGTHKVFNNDVRTDMGRVVKANGKYTATSFGGGAMVGYKMPMSGVVLVPTIGLNYSHVGKTNYTETGAINNRNVSTKSANRLDAMVGLKVASKPYMLTDSLKLLPEVHASVSHDLIGKAPKQTVDARNFNRSSISGRKVIRTEFTVGADLKAEHGMMEYGAGYDFKVAKKRIGHEGSLIVRVNF